MANRKYKLGQKVILSGGIKVQITGVNPDGTANFSEINPATKQPYPFSKGSHGKMPALSQETIDASWISFEDDDVVEISFDEGIYSLAKDLDSYTRSGGKDALEINSKANDVYDRFMGLDYIDRQTFLDAISFNEFESLTNSLEEEKKNRFLVANLFNDKVYEESINSLVETAYFTDSEAEDINPDDELAPSARKLLENDFNKFVADNILYVAEATQKDSGYSAQNLASDFWYTRNGHGVGFWDREALKPYGLGDQLTEASKKFRPVNLVKGDDNAIYVE